ncbi:DUF4397 domain-containing protein [Aestuariimicrobium sp. T2.26MG-19.2B]|uniref:DUF4397 domain-containing protein n=1 Tax=Aestuariimicrobium sp. T2.26MG-19.2B TaxID=3040679 RepID=UPI002477690E|nr:DUF4397 domain-containing protein [Aestuariimicrobium sp. T2.26MG-19.2B]CAI9403316.1 hypothetical protein AESSP_00980 [Aestuariimicrobium sp. T2.26MG-19.2B]
MHTIRRVAAALSATLLAILGMALTSPAAHSSPQTSQVSVLHAVPGATVDVWANGKPLLTNFKPGTLTEPQALPAGSYDIKIVKAGDPATAAAVIEAKGLQVPAGANLTLVAHLDAMGKPVLTAFANDTSASSKGARLTVRHVAAAPAVDVRAGGKVVVPGLVNPKQAALDLAPGTVSADVVLAGTDTVAIGPADVKLSQGHNTIVYAWGSAEGKNLALAVQQVTLMGGGLPHTGVADEPTSNVLPIVASAVMVAFVGALALRRTRSAVRN